ncbi:MAG TPA: TIGR02678 family protein [Solirubrobacteraceae bacterium]|nr:TIGR02678 family protein [Solirubrobacteraceae bacterium]
MNPDAVVQAAAEERLRAMRALLERQVLTHRDPELALARRHREQLVAIARDQLGATLTITADTAHLSKHVTLAGARPLRLSPRSANERSKPVDERRVLNKRGCLLACVVAGVLERRTWTQVPLGALAEEVLIHARTLGVVLDWRARADRMALADGIEFFTGAGVLELRSGAAGELDSDDEAFYDVHRRRLALLLADPVRTAEATEPHQLETAAEGGGDLAGRARSRRLVRALVEDPVLYLDDLGEEDRIYFLAQRARLEGLAAGITGLAVERRREGTALVATGRELTDRPFPARGHVKQLALLLLPELCARDAGAGTSIAPQEQHALVRALLERHAEHWTAWDAGDPEVVGRACRDALDVLSDLRLVTRLAGGEDIRVLPLARRYRAAVSHRHAPAQLELS